MKMISIIITLLIFITVILYIGDTKITFNPFTFKITNWTSIIGWICLGLAFILIPYKSIKDAEFRGYKEGQEDLTKALMEDLDQQIEQVKRDKKSKDEKGGLNK